jgi:hypothetical protein
MNKNWFIKTSKGQILGPISELQCKKGIEERGDLTDFFVRQGDSAWKPAKEVLELFRRLEHEGLYIEQAGKIFGPFTEAKFLEMVPNCDVTANWRKGSTGIWYPIQPIKTNPINYLMQPVLGQAPKTQEVTVPVSTHVLSTQLTDELPWTSGRDSVVSLFPKSKYRQRYTATSSSSIPLKVFGSTLGFVLVTVFVFWLIESNSGLGTSLKFLSQILKSKPTKMEWLEKIDKKFMCQYHDGQIYFNEPHPTIDSFFKVIGKPDSFQVIQGERIWYYECSDGQIQLINELPFNNLVILKMNIY